MYLPIISRLFDISFTISSRSEAIFHGKFCTNDKIIRLAEIQCCLLFEGALQKKEKINHDMSLFVVWTWNNSLYDSLTTIRRPIKLSPRRVRWHLSRPGPDLIGRCWNLWNPLCRGPRSKTWFSSRPKCVYNHGIKIYDHTLVCWSLMSPIAWHSNHQTI